MGRTGAMGIRIVRGKTEERLGFVPGQVRLIWEVESEARCESWHDLVFECVAAETMYWDSTKNRTMWSPCQGRGYVSIADKRESGATYPVVLCRKHTRQWEEGEVDQEVERMRRMERIVVGVLCAMAVGVVVAVMVR